MTIASEVEVKQVRLVKGTGAQIKSARQAGEILDTDLVVQIDAPEPATAEQGALAETALQPGDNITELVNNADYATNTQVSSVVTNHNTDQTAHSYIQGLISSEESRAEGVEGVLSNLTTDVKNNLVSAINEVDSHADTNANNISDIKALIPNDASTSNQLADKGFVNSSIATNTANFIGTFNSIAELEAYSGTLTNNDYAFVIGIDSAGNTVYDRYKYTDSTTPASWVFEYELNNSSFTADQWAAINSLATAGKITQITTNQNAIGTLSSLTTTAKTSLVNAINELDSDKLDKNTAITGATKCKITYDGNGLVTGGSDLSTSDIPSLTLSKISDITATASELNVLDGITVSTAELNYTDGVTSNIQTQLNGKVPNTRTVNGKALSSNIILNAGDIGALPNSTAIPSKTSDLTNDSGFISGITSAMVTTALGYSPVNPTTLATVATSGSYNDLSNKPTIPAAQVNSDWNANSGVAQILNKPTLATVATSGVYSDLSGKPTIPTVNNPTITLTQGGTTKGSFTLNQSSGATIDLDAGGSVKTHDLFDNKWTDHLLNDQDWLRADTFSWQDGTVYTNAYNHLVDDVDGKTASNSDTIGSYTIYYVLADDGHKIVGPDQEATVNNIYNESGVAWYYVLDKTNQRFKLPRELPITDKSKGNGKALGLNYGVSNVSYMHFLTEGAQSSGQHMYRSAESGGTYGNATTHMGLIEDPTKSGIISHRANENGQQYLYFYVGQFSQTATEQTAGLNSELFNGKADIEALNNKIQLVSTPPATQTSGVLYVIPE